MCPECRVVYGFGMRSKASQRIELRAGLLCYRCRRARLDLVAYDVEGRLFVPEDVELRACRDRRACSVRLRRAERSGWTWRPAVAAAAVLVALLAATRAAGGW